MALLRRQLSESAALPELSVLAVAVGLVTGVVVLLFRGAIEGVAWLLHGTTTDGYQAASYSIACHRTPVVSASFTSWNAWHAIAAGCL